MAAEATSTMVGPYRVDGLIGRGGMGEVFRAWDTRRQRTVALKLLPTALSGDVEYRERFRRESLVAAALTSPHVVPIHDFGDIEGRLFIDMRLIEGADLSSHASGRSMSPQRAVAIVIQVCDALANAHARGIIHRDVKPSNILITDSDFAYLVDFGIAASDAAGSSLTATGNTVGTFGYMAPERFDGRHADPRADIYSLGCVLHELLTGARPFADQTSTPSLIRAHLMLDPAPPSASGAPVPPALDQAVLRALAKDPALRHHNITELADELRNSVAVPSQRGPAERQFTSFAATPESPLQAQIVTENSPASARLRPSTPARIGKLQKVILAGAAVALLGAGVATGSIINSGGNDTTSASSTTTYSPNSSALFGGASERTAALAFGDSIELRPGVTATAGEPQPYQPSSSAAGEEGAARVMRVEVTLTNETDRFINFSEQYYMSIEIDGARTNSIMDSFNNYDHSVGSVHHKAVPPGGEAVFSAAWALPASTTPVSLELAPSGSGAGGATATWAGDA